MIMQFITPCEHEFFIHLKLSFIDPLRELGFECKSYAEMGDKEQGTHILYFQHNNEDYDLRLMGIKLKSLMQDDDSQPFSTYRLYMGSLWIYIPYLA